MTRPRGKARRQRQREAGQGELREPTNTADVAREQRDRFEKRKICPPASGPVQRGPRTKRPTWGNPARKRVA